MMGEFIRDRKVETILADICEEQAINHEIFSDGWMHVFEKDDKSAKLIGYKWGINDAAASGIAADKVATYELLSARGISAIEHRLVRTKADFSPHWPKILPESFVLKPLTGTSGHGIALCHSKQQAEQHIKSLKICAWAMSPYASIKSEVRLIMLDGACLLAYEKQQPVVQDGLAFYNLGIGAMAVDVEPSGELTAMATKAVSALGLRLAAVDMVQVDGKYQVLEINDGFMMEHYLRQSSENHQEASNLYGKILATSLL